MKTKILIMAPDETVISLPLPVNKLKSDSLPISILMQQHPIPDLCGRAIEQYQKGVDAGCYADYTYTIITA